MEASSEPSEPDDAFWQFVDETFSELNEEDGEEVDNLFWVQRVSEPTVEKLVIRVGGSTRLVARSVRALLQEGESPFVGAKLLVNSDVLVILYVRRGAPQPDADFLHDVAECCEAVPFVPFNSSVGEASLVWVSRSDESGSFCGPVY